MRTTSAFAVLFLDLDGFKQINDRRGHGAGDQVLAGVAERLRRAVRPNDTVARFGGDEFVVLCEETRTAEEAAGLADRIAGALQAPFVVDGQEHTVTASVGIAVAGGSDSADTLLRRADRAMYRAKVQGPGRYQLDDDRGDQAGDSLSEIDLRPGGWGPPGHGVGA